MKTNALMALGILLVASSTSYGQEEWSLSWCELSPVVAGKKVRLNLADGENVSGRALAVKGDSLRALVERSSDRNKHPRGEVAFPRDSIREIRLISSGYKGKIIGTVAGVVGGLFLGAVVGYGAESAGAFLGTWAGTAVGGIALGAAADRQVRLIRLRAGDPPCEELPKSTGNAPGVGALAGPGDNITRPLIGIGGSPTYATSRGENTYAYIDNGIQIPKWHRDQWREASLSRPGDSKADSLAVQASVPHEDALR